MKSPALDDILVKLQTIRKFEVAGHGRRLLPLVEALTGPVAGSVWPLLDRVLGIPPKVDVVSAGVMIVAEKILEIFSDQAGQQEKRFDDTVIQQTVWIPNAVQVSPTIEPEDLGSTTAEDTDTAAEVEGDEDPEPEEKSVGPLPRSKFPPFPSCNCGICRALRGA